MSDPVLIGLISTLGVLAATVIVEIVRNRSMHAENKSKLDSVIYETTPNSGKSMKDSLSRIEGKVDAMDERQRDYSEQLTTVTVRLDEHLRSHP